MKYFNVTFLYRGESVFYRSNQTRQQIYDLWLDAEAGLIVYDSVQITLI